MGEHVTWGVVGLDKDWQWKVCVRVFVCVCVCVRARVCVVCERSCVGEL